MVEDLSKSGLNDDHIKRSKSYKPCTQIDALKRYKYDGVGYEIDYPDPRTGKLTDPLGKLVA